MAEVKKFLFDNFVVGRGDTKIPEPIPEVPEEQVIEQETDENVLSEEPEAVVIEETFSREELEAKATLAHQE